MLENPNDPFCVVKLHEELLRRYKRAQPGYTGRIFRRPVKKGGVIFNMPNMKDNGVVGKNQFSAMTRKVAHRTGMTNPDKCTAGGRRRAGITNLANLANAVPEAERMRMARHKCPSTHAKYQEVSEEMKNQRYKAMFYNPEKFGKFNLFV